MTASAISGPETKNDRMAATSAAIARSLLTERVVFTGSSMMAASVRVERTSLLAQNQLPYHLAKMQCGDSDLQTQESLALPACGVPSIHGHTLLSLYSYSTGPFDSFADDLNTRLITGLGHPGYVLDTIPVCSPVRIWYLRMESNHAKQGISLLSPIG